MHIMDVSALVSVKLALVNAPGSVWMLVMGDIAQE